MEAPTEPEVQAARTEAWLKPPAAVSAGDATVDAPIQTGPSLEAPLDEAEPQDDPQVNPALLETLDTLPVPTLADVEANDLLPKEPVDPVAALPDDVLPPKEEKREEAELQSRSSLPGTPSKQSEQRYG